jgi:hypothetical protein
MSGSTRINLKLAPVEVADRVAIGRGVTLHLARLTPKDVGAARCESMFAVEGLKHRCKGEGRTPSTKEIESTVLRVFALFSIAGWDGVLGEDDAPAPVNAATLAAIQAAAPELSPQIQIAINDHLADLWEDSGDHAQRFIENRIRLLTGERPVEAAA